MYIVLMASFHEGKKTYSEKALKKYDNVHMTLQIPISCDLPVANGLSWHTRLPILAVGSDRRVELWSVET